jgi:hypothetical protein
MMADTLRGSVRSGEARSFLKNPGNAESFLETMRSVSKGLFSKEGAPGGIDERAMRVIGDMPSRDVFKNCFVTISESSRSEAVTPDQLAKLRQFGRFLIAATEYGVTPELDAGKSETFRAYMERVSVALIKNGKSASILLGAGLKDEEIDARAAAAAATLGSKGR